MLKRAKKMRGASRSDLQLQGREVASFQRGALDVASFPIYVGGDGYSFPITTTGRRYLPSPYSGDDKSGIVPGERWFNSSTHGGVSKILGVTMEKCSAAH